MNSWPADNGAAGTIRTSCWRGLENSAAAPSTRTPRTGSRKSRWKDDRSSVASTVSLVCPESRPLPNR